jgi:hypothetical protein
LAGPSTKGNDELINCLFADTSIKKWHGAVAWRIRSQAGKKCAPSQPAQPALQPRCYAGLSCYTIGAALPRSCDARKANITMRHSLASANAVQSAGRRGLVRGDADGYGPRALTNIWDRLH